MLKKMSIRLRLTILSVVLLTICCVGLTFILNISANRMADVVEAMPVTPAQSINSDEFVQEEIPAEEMRPVTRTATSQEARTQFLQNSIFYMVLVVLLGGGLTYYLSGTALKPLQKLSRQMKDISVDNLSQNLPVPESLDEIADLTRTFNQMSSNLDEAFAMQKRFSQSAAHELRTPLTVLKTKVEVFNKRKEHTPAEYDKLLSVITTHTKRLSDLVKDLLSLTNMDALECSEPVALEVLLIEVIDELTVLAKEKNISITVDAEEKMIQGNESLLHRAFYNLLENAIKYNLVGGRVDIHLAVEKEHSVITFSDTGIGIPANLQELIFEPFYRVDKSRSRQMGGAGLGLSTVKTIIEKHHGQISVCENPNGGSIFKVIL